MIAIDTNSKGQFSEDNWEAVVWHSNVSYETIKKLDNFFVSFLSAWMINKFVVHTPASK